MPICIPYVIIFHFVSSCVLHPYLAQIHISITINHVTIEVPHCCMIAFGSNTDSVSDFVFAFPTRICIPKCILFLRSSCVLHCTPFFHFQLDTHFTNGLFLLLSDHLRIIFVHTLRLFVLLLVLCCFDVIIPCLSCRRRCSQPYSLSRDAYETKVSDQH